MDKFLKLGILVFLFIIVVSCSKNPSETEKKDNNSNNIDTIEEDVIEEIEWINIPAGEYTCGDSSEICNIDYDYQIMKYEVTNEEYVRFLNEAYSVGYVKVGWDGFIMGYYPGDEDFPEDSTYIYTWTFEADSYDSIYSIHFDGSKFGIDTSLRKHPVNYICYFGACGFTNFYNFRLPTVEEWEKAARGETGRKFPWGNTEEYDRVNLWNSGDPYETGTTPVGFYDGSNQNGYITKDDSSPFGLHDLEGNVSEWTMSKDSDTGYMISKGGNYFFNWFPECWINFGVNQHYRYAPGDGFRCVRDIQE